MWSDILGRRVGTQTTRWTTLPSGATRREHNASCGKERGTVIDNVRFTALMWTLRQRLNLPTTPAQRSKGKVNPGFVVRAGAATTSGPRHAKPEATCTIKLSGTRGSSALARVLDPIDLTNLADKRLRDGDVVYQRDPASRDDMSYAKIVWKTGRVETRRCLVALSVDASV